MHMPPNWAPEGQWLTSDKHEVPFYVLHCSRITWIIKIWHIKRMVSFYYKMTTSGHFSWLIYLIPVVNSDLRLQTTCGRGASGTDKRWLSDKIKTLYMDAATVLQMLQWTDKRIYNMWRLDMLFFNSRLFIFFQWSCRFTAKFWLHTGSYNYTIDIVKAWVVILLFFQALIGPLFITQVKNEHKVMMRIFKFMSIQNKLIQISSKN